MNAFHPLEFKGNVLLTGTFLEYKPALEITRFSDRDGRYRRVALRDVFTPESLGQCNHARPDPS